MFSIPTLIKDDQEPTIMSKYNDNWIEKELLTNKNDIHKTLDWCDEKFNKTTLTITMGCFRSFFRWETASHPP